MKRAFTLILALAMVVTLAAISPAARAEDDFGTGIVKNNVYWNETMEIGCALDENWYFYTQEEILQANGMTVDMLEGELAEIVKDGGSLTDMFAENQETGANVNVCFERLSLANSLIFDETTYLDASESMLKDAFEQIGIENVEIIQQDMEFMGQEHRSLSISGSISTIPIFETMVVLKSGRNVTIVTVFSLDEAEIAGVLSCFFDSLD
ncbi:MAG: hypothetical protein ACI3XG_09195 [Faecousia sp.]